MVKKPIFEIILVLIARKADHSPRLELKGEDSVLFETQHPQCTEADQFTVGDTLKLRQERVYACA